VFRFLYIALSIGITIISTQNAQAALAPDVQQLVEEEKVLESNELQGKKISNIRSERGDESTLYFIEADCTYVFEVTYPFDWRGLFGWVGPKLFDVDMIGEPSCPLHPAPNINRMAFHQAILKAVATVYIMPIETIHTSTNLYAAPKDPAQRGMDFRILGLRRFIEEQIGCQMDSKAYAKIRTVGDLLSATDVHCNNSP